jgi:hypothetical protein
MPVLLCDTNVVFLLNWGDYRQKCAIIHIAPCILYLSTVLAQKMKIKSGNAESITCAGSFFSIIIGGKIVETIKKNGAAYDAKTVVVDGVAQVEFMIDSKSGTIEVSCSPAEWRDINESRGVFMRATNIVKRAAAKTNEFITRGKPCCGG